MLFSNLLGSLPSISEGLTEQSTPAVNNGGTFFYNLFKFFAGMAKALEGLFTKTIEINGEPISIWLIFGGTAITAIILWVILRKIIH